MACKELGIPIKTQEYTGDDPQGFVHSLNDKRRHQTKDERIEQALKERQIIDERTGKPKYTFEELAEKHNVSVSTLKRATPAKHSPSKKQRFNEPFDDVQPIDYSKIVPKDSELENVSSVHSIDVKTMTEQDKKDTEEVNKEVKEFHKKQGLEILREFVKKFSDVDEFIDIIKTIKNYDHKKES
jgi:arsenate reductase-like glutaredoxin family protein